MLARFGRHSRLCREGSIHCENISVRTGMSSVPSWPVSNLPTGNGAVRMTRDHWRHTKTIVGVDSHKKVQRIFMSVGTVDGLGETVLRIGR